MKLPGVITIFLFLVSPHYTEQLGTISVGQQVGVFPNNHTLARAEGNVTFTCLPLYTTSNKLESAEWIINGSRFEDSHLTNLDARFIPIGNGVGILRITGVSMDYNNTSFQCRGHFSEGEILDSNLATINIQREYLGPVQSLAARGQGSEVQLSWESPFSETNLTFCVRVTSSLTHKEDSLCGLSTLTFSYHLPNISCEIYSFSVHPVNARGEKGPVATTSYFGVRTRPSIRIKEMLNRTDVITYSIIMSAPVCTAEVEFLDVDTKEKSTAEDVILNFTDIDSITFSSHKIRESRRYNVTLVVRNIAGLTLENFEISTHGVNNFTIKTESNVSISTQYAENSQAKGVLFYFVPLTEDGSMNPDFPPRLLPLSRNASKNHTLDKTYAGRIKVLAYDIGRNGTLPIGTNYPANTQDLNLGSGGNSPTNQQDFHPRFSRSAEPRHNKNCSISITGRRTITSLCSFNRFQMIAQLVSTSRLEERLYTNVTSDRQSPASVEVDDNGLYQVTIFAVTAVSGVLDSEVQYSENVEISDDFDKPIPWSSASGSQSLSSSISWIWLLVVLLLFRAYNVC